MSNLRQRLEAFAQAKQSIGVNFAASAGTKLVSATGTVIEVGDDYFAMNDIYGNSMVVPTAGVAYIEIKK